MTLYVYLFAFVGVLEILNPSLTVCVDFSTESSGWNFHTLKKDGEVQSNISWYIYTHWSNDIHTWTSGTWWPENILVITSCHCYTKWGRKWHLTSNWRDNDNFSVTNNSLQLPRANTGWGIITSITSCIGKKNISSSSNSMNFLCEWK